MKLFGLVCFFLIFSRMGDSRVGRDVQRPFSWKTTSYLLVRGSKKKQIPETKHTDGTTPFPFPMETPAPRSRLTAAGGGAGRCHARIAQSASPPPRPKPSPFPPSAAGRARQSPAPLGALPLAAREGAPKFGWCARCHCARVPGHAGGGSVARPFPLRASGASGARPAAGGRCGGGGGGGGRAPSFGFGGRSVCPPAFLLLLGSSGRAEPTSRCCLGEKALRRRR